MAIKKQKKVGVKFKEVANKQYCYLTYDGKNTRFPYYVGGSNDDLYDGNVIEDIDIEFESNFVRRCLRYILSNSEKFKLNKNSANLILNYGHQITSQWEGGIVYELGEILNYNQFSFLKKKAKKRYVLYYFLNDFLDFKGYEQKELKRLKLSKSTILNQLSGQSIFFLNVYLLTFFFEKENKIRLIDWYDNLDNVMEMFEEFFQKSKGNIGANLNYKVPKSSKFNFKSASMLLLEEVSAMRNLDGEILSGN